MGMEELEDDEKEEEESSADFAELLSPEPRSWEALAIGTVGGDTISRGTNCDCEGTLFCPASLTPRRCGPAPFWALRERIRASHPPLNSIHLPTQPEASSRGGCCTT